MSLHSSELSPSENTSPLNLGWREKRYARFYQIVDLLVDQIQHHAYANTGKPKRKVRGAELEKLHYSVECLLRDSVAVVLNRKRKGEAAIKKGQHHYSADRSDEMLTYSIHIQRAFTALIEMGYLEVTRKGNYDRKGQKDGSRQNKLTRYAATDRLLALFTENEIKALPAHLPVYRHPQLIKVRAKELDEYGLEHRVTLQYEESPETERIIANLKTINNALARNWYDLEISDDELLALQMRLAGDKFEERQIRLDHKTLYRVFNDTGLTTGGRFYGGWWQNIPKEYRHYLAVNGKKMVELDYSNQHPTILYALEGATRPEDCYSNIIKPRKNSDNVEGLRKQIKLAFNAMLNAKQPLQRPPKDISFAPYGLKWKEVAKAIMVAHHPISHHFYTGVGLRLQRIDSDIAERILLHFTSNSIPILPLHDSFLMHNGYETWLEPVMLKAFEDVVGRTPKIEKKVKKKAHPGDGANNAQQDSSAVRSATDDFDDDLDPITDDIEVLAARFQGHDHRLGAFFASRH